MSFFLFIKIFFICLLGAMSPGPSMLIVINNALISKLNGIMTSIGHGLGIGIYALFAVIGLDLLAQNNQNIFLFLKVISIIFLFYLGVSSLFNKYELNNKDYVKSNKSYLYGFAQGFTISILNPKIFVFFAAIYSQFISIENNEILNITLVLTAMIVDAIWYIVLTFLITFVGISSLTKQKTKIIKKIVGIFFILISMALIFNLIK
ncbi:MAG: hypothetical protein CMI90_04220 [Pelagibacteraceae bacterium]|nr:hypothetical protein [Pelagibacteraceae bacterium]